MPTPKMTNSPVVDTQPEPPVIESKPCSVYEKADHSLSVTFTIEPVAAKRLYMKASGMPIDRFLYENILKRAVETSLF